MNKLQSQITSWKERGKTRANKIIISASLLAVLGFGALKYSHLTQNTRMHKIDDSKLSEQIFVDADQLKTATKVYFYPTSNSPGSLFAEVSYDDKGDMVVSHDDIVVKINLDNKTAIGYDLNGMFSLDNPDKTYPKYLDDETIGNILNMCVNGTPDFASNHN